MSAPLAVAVDAAGGGQTCFAAEANSEVLHEVHTLVFRRK